MTKMWTKTIATSALALLTAGGVASALPMTVDAASKPVKITFWHAMSGPYQKALQKQINEFNKSQSKYKVVGTAQGDYKTLNQKIMAGAKSKTLPTMAQTTYTQVPDYEKNGIVQDVDSQIKSKQGLSKKELNNIYPGFLEQSKYQGHYYSMPFSSSLRVMAYNKDILDKYNLSVPKTWNDVKKMGETLKPHKIAAVGYDQSFDAEWQAMTKAAGKQVITPSGKVNVASKQSKKAMNDLMSMVKDGTAKTAGADIYGTTSFVNGKTAVYMLSSAGITATKKAAPDNLHWGTAVMPEYQGKQRSMLAGNNLVLTSQADKKQSDGAFAFIKFLISDKQTEQWAEDTGYIPVTKKAVKSADYKNYLDKNPLAKAATDSLPGAFADTSFVGYQEYRTDMLESIDSMLTKDTKPDNALNKLDKQTTKIIKDNK